MTPDPRNNSSYLDKSLRTPRVLLNREVHYSIDPNKHDPIFNPIGAEIPNIMRSQNFGRKSGISKLAQAGNSIFS